MDSPHKGQWRWALMFSLNCAWTNVWANNRDSGDLRRHRTHYGVTVMKNHIITTTKPVTAIIPCDILVIIVKRWLHDWINMDRDYNPLFPRPFVLYQNTACQKIRVKSFVSIMKFSWHLGISAAKMPVKSLSDTIITASNLADSRLRDILRWNVSPLDSCWSTTTSGIYGQL